MVGNLKQNQSRNEKVQKKSIIKKKSDCGMKHKDVFNSGVYEIHEISCKHNKIWSV